MPRLRGCEMRVVLFGHFRYIVGEKEADVDFGGGSAAQALEAVSVKWPELGRAVLEDGRVRPYVNVTVNDVNIRDLGGLEAKVSAGDKLTLFPPMAGG